MRALDIIQKKRDGHSLSSSELKHLIFGYTQGDLPDYQMSAFLMACYFKPPTFEETLELTRAMLHSGKTIDLSGLDRPKIDKHSTGGVGDKTSLIITPIVASFDVCVPMISGRGLGHTGGTLDKLEAIPGFNIHLSLNEFKRLLKKSNMAMMGQTPEIAPADKKIYALRDVTATVDSLPLIASSIMSKKLAEGSDGIVLDVKFGSGAFMQEKKEAIQLAEWLVRIGKAFGKKMSALITNMDQPLGSKIGNSLEVEESVDVLKGAGPKDLQELCLHLSAHMLFLAKKVKTIESGIQKAKEAIASGRALEKFSQMVSQQGGKTAWIQNFKLLPHAKKQKSFKAQASGIIQKINTRQIGVLACILGAGRSTVEDRIDPTVGFELYKKVGDTVQKGEDLLRVYYNDEAKYTAVEEGLRSAYTIGQKKPKPIPLIDQIKGEVQ